MIEESKEETSTEEVQTDPLKDKAIFSFIGDFIKNYIRIRGIQFLNLLYGGKRQEYA